MARESTDERTKALFADAERSAERVVGQLRMAIALSLGAVFAIAVVMHAQRDDAVLAVQITAASATIVAYLALGALSYHLAVPHRFRPWMPWAFVLPAAQAFDLAEEHQPARRVRVGEPRQEEPPEQAGEHAHR